MAVPPDSSSSALAIDLVLEDAGSDHLTTLAFRHARITGGVWLHSAELPYRKDASGLKIGIQSQIAIDRDGSDAVDLADLADAYAARCLPNAPDQSSEPVSADWLDIVATVERRLGFVLEPELFSNMLFCAHLGGLEDPHIASTARELLSTFRRTDARGLYHFFVSLRFACDVDCTAVAVRGRLKLGDIDLRVLSGVAELRRITGRILGSAAVGHVDPRTNRTHGKNNGELRRHVFKVYLDDHTVQGADLDRGLKNDAVVVLNALHPVLLELREGLRSPMEDKSSPAAATPVSAEKPQATNASPAALASASVKAVPPANDTVPPAASSSTAAPSMPTAANDRSVHALSSEPKATDSRASASPKPAVSETSSKPISRDTAQSATTAKPAGETDSKPVRETAKPAATSSGDESQRVSQRQPSQLKSTVRSLANKEDSSGESSNSTTTATPTSGGGLSFASRKVADVKPIKTDSKTSSANTETSDE